MSVRRAVFLLRDMFYVVIIAFIVRTVGYGLYRVPTGSMETTMLVGELFFADKFTPLFVPLKQGDIIAFNDPLFAYARTKVVRIFQQYVWGPANWTKRIIGVPGDTMQGVIEDGKPVVYRNGAKLDESYVNTAPLIAVWKRDPNTIRAASTARDVQMLHENWSFKSCDINRSFHEQPWYRIDQTYIMQDADGSTIMRLPHIPCMSTMPHKASMKRFWDGSDEFCVPLASGEYWVMGDNRRDSYDSRSFGPVSRTAIHGKIIVRLASCDTDASWMVAHIFTQPKDFLKRIRWHRWLQRVH